MNGSLTIQRIVVLLKAHQRLPLVVRRFFWRWRGECLLFGLWCLKPLDVYPFNRGYRALLARLVRRTGLFDEAYYAEVNTDVARSGEGMLVHYVAWGDREGRWPMPLFDPSYYRSHAAGFTYTVNTLLHYMWVGVHRDFSPSAWFDTAWYLRENRDVALSGVNPLLHFLQWAGEEGRSPSPDFDTRYYLNAHSDVAESGLNPLVHYVLYGRHKGYGIREEQTTAAGRQRVPYESEQAPMSLAQVIENARHPMGEPVVDVIVPVYRNHALTLRCLKSVLSAQVDTPYQLIVIDDASPEVGLKEDLEKLAEEQWLILVENRENQGFVASVNRGMRLHPGRDVVLLNSDTEVYDGWVDRLRRQAYQNDRVASVTPLSNNATICSYPRFPHDNPYPLEIGYEELDRLCAEINPGQSVDAPTGVGFCMYMRREALDAVGLFDEKAFGRGYGEENDWCQRAIEAGWVNRIAADTFVRHFGSASFQGEREHRVQKAMAVMAKRHPSYDRQVKRFIVDDPLRAARERLDMARLKRWAREENVLMACHSRGGGAERHLQEDAQKQRDRGRGVFFLRPVPGRPTHALIRHSECTHLPNFPELELKDIERMAGIISELGITCLHSHGLVDFEPQAADYIRQVCEKAKIPLHVDIHDYKVVCPRINLARNDGMYCGEPQDEQTCDDCLRKEGNDFGVTNIAEWRYMHHRVLKMAEKIYVPDEDVSDRLSRYFPDLCFRIFPHEEIEYRPVYRQPNPGERLRVVVIGAISKIKGYDILLGCAKYVKARSLPIEFVLMGYSVDNYKLTKAGVRVVGRYFQDEAAKILEEIDPHMSFFPSLCPETYSYTLSIAMQAKLPVIAFSLGAIARRVKSGGVLLPLPRSASNSEMRRIVDVMMAVGYNVCVDEEECIRALKG